MLQLLPTLLVLLSAEGGGRPVPEPASVAWDGESVRLHTDAPARLQLSVPTADYLVEARHFPAGPAGVLRHTLLVTGSRGQLLLVDVFDNPDRLTLGQFFEVHLGWLRDPSTSVLDGVAGKDGVPALLVDQPRTGQAWAQRLAVFALGDRILKVSCLNRDDPILLRLFERALESVGEPPEVAP